MGLLDYYRQFEDLDEQALNRERRAQRERDRALALARVPELDLSSTEWPELPDSEVINASIHAARGRVNGYPDRNADGLRRILAERHGVQRERIALGNGAAELLQAAALSLMSDGDELVTPWPSYPLYPLMAARAGGRPVPVTAPGIDSLLEAMTERARVVVLCNPNDPTGSHLGADAVASLAGALPERVHLLVDEALVHFADVPDVDAVLRLTDAFPRLLVVRSFSKIYGLSGLRAGYAVGSAASTALLDAISPVLGVNALTQAAVHQALRIGAAGVERRRSTVIRERNRLLEALDQLAVEVAPSQANFVWMRAREASGRELASRLRERGVIVAAGAPLGYERHVRASVRDAAATDRLLAAVEGATGAA